VVSVSPVGEGLVVGAKDHFVPGLLQPEAQSSGATEEVSCQARTLTAQALGVSQEHFDVVGVVSMRRETDEGPADQSDTITTVLTRFLGLSRHGLTLTAQADAPT
jgi:hypothetical protein